MADLNLIKLGWLFFTVWTIIVAGLSLKVFGPDVLRELESERQKVGSVK